MKAAILFPSVMLASAFLAPLAVHASQPSVAEPVVSFWFAVPEFTAPEEQQSGAYADGTRAINAGRWSEAELIFSKIAAEHGDRADAALYWKAYAQNKAGQQAHAVETCAQLHAGYSRSRYVSDCDALRVEIQGPGATSFFGRRPAELASNPDEDMKLLALNALMQQDESKALPVVQQILNGNGSDRLKEKALFVLAQSRSPQAQQALGEIARGQKNPALQLRAIKMYAAIGGKRSIDGLADIYQHSSDVEVKRAILQAYLIAGTPDKLMEVARGEQNPELAKNAVRELGAMGAVTELTNLYGATKDVQTKQAILGALFSSGGRGMDALKSIATTEQNPDLRRRAIRNLGAAGGASAAPALLAAYQGSTDTDSKRAAVEGLFFAGDAHDLIALARAEKDPEMKKSIVARLSMMRSQEATEYMMEILNK